VSKLLPLLPEQSYVQDTESSATIIVVRGARTIKVSETLIGDDMASEQETKEAIARLAAAVSAVL
jgi:hypothetical protein